MSTIIKNFSQKAMLFSSLITIGSCAEFYEKHDLPKDPIDRVNDLKREDYLKQLSPKPAPEVKVEAKPPAIPTATDLVLTPQKPRLGINKTVSLSVTDEVPLKDVFIELARLADIDIEVDPAITGGIIFKAKNKPFDEVIERICDLAGLRYTVKNGVIRVESDKPYVENYQVNFLNVIRTVNGGVTSNTTLGGTGGGSSGGGGGGSGGSGTSSGSSGGSGGSGGSNSAGASIANGSNNNISYKSSGDGDVWKSIEAQISAVVGNAPSGAGKDQFTKSNGEYKADGSDATKFVALNREAGVVSVKTTGKNHAIIKQYLEKVKDFYSSQVLIEAKVVEVSLNDQFRSGIDWNLAAQHLLGGTVTAALPTAGLQALSQPDLADSLFSTVTLRAGDLNAVVKLAELFGTTRTLSSPRIMVMNNQQAALSFAKNENYYSLSCDVTDPVQPTTQGGIPTPGKLKVSSTLNSIPIGVILNLQPSIDSKNAQISMDIRPTLTRLTGKTSTDPAIILCGANARQLGFDAAELDQLIRTSLVPQVDVREMDSVLRLKSGEIMAIGGMIDQKITNDDSGIPYLSSIPVLGNAFKAVDKTNQTVQTVIFLKATIVPGYGVDKEDQKLYNKFNSDPRPETF